MISHHFVDLDELILKMYIKNVYILIKIPISEKKFRIQFNLFRISFFGLQCIFFLLIHV